jgi:hypothetical protein
MTYHTRAYPSGSVKERGTEREQIETIWVFRNLRKFVRF